MKKAVLLLSLIFLVVLGCNKQLTKYESSSAPAKAIYVGSQIEKLKTDGRVPKNDQIIVELLTFHGVRYQGRLFQITDHEVLISEGYTTKTAGQRTFKEEQLVEIKKDELLIVKMW